MYLSPESRKREGSCFHLFLLVLIFILDKIPPPQGGGENGQNIYPWEIWPCLKSTYILWSKQWHKSLGRILYILAEEEIRGCHPLII